MTTPESPLIDAAMEHAGASPERRLHPWSWLFVLIQQLKQFIVPLLALVFFRRGDSEELWPMIGVAALALFSLWQYFTYRYRIDGHSLTIRSGLLHRSLRQIPFSRIHNVALHRTVLHRVFGVAEVRLESAGGAKPEAEMRVLRLDEAMALDALVRHRGPVTTAIREDATVADTLLAPTEMLVHLPIGEVLRLGLISNRGLIMVAGGMAALSQFAPRLLSNTMERLGKRVFGYADAHHFGWMDYALAAVALTLGVLVLLRSLSVALAVLQYHDFRLERDGRRLTVERGLLTRLRTSAPRRRIQAWTLKEGVLHRLLRRRTLEVDSAVSQQSGGEHGQRGLRELAPVATPDHCDALVNALLPRVQWPPLQWRALHRHAVWRLLIGDALFIAVVVAGLWWKFGAWGLLALAWLPWAAYVARSHARNAGYALDERLVAVREGWWSRHWRFAEIDKLQALRLTRSWLDRRFGMATLWLDTAGANALAPSLRLRFLPVADAERLLDTLQSQVAARPLRW